jgi:hypothetical protein
MRLLLAHGWESTMLASAGLMPTTASHGEHESEGHGFSRAENRCAAGASALPKTVVEREARND